MTGLRVIGGIARGRRLRAVPGDTTRPITDRTKESLFNIIGADIQNATFLDLFAGTGSVGIEALSRGAAFVRFIDKEAKAVQTVSINLASTGLQRDEPQANVDVRRQDALALLEQKPDLLFDYVYIAPPQYKGLWKRALLCLDDHPVWLSEDAWVMIQIHPVEYEHLELKSLIEFDLRRYGSTQLIFYERIPE